MNTPCTFSIYKYILPNGRKIFLTNRPDRCDLKQVRQFVKKEKPMVRFQFTDDWVDYKGGPPWHWYIWAIYGSPTLESVFAFIQLMDWYNKKKSKRSIWLHCDSSSMRTPTFFGLYLSVFYPDKIEKISKNVISNYEKDHVSSPYEYVNTELKQSLKMKEMIRIWKIEGLEAVNEYVIDMAKEGGET